MTTLFHHLEFLNFTFFSLATGIGAFLGCLAGIRLPSPDRESHHHG